VRVVERMDRERVIYTEEIDALCVVERTDQERVRCALELDRR
jgi:hypothetical protein